MRNRILLVEDNESDEKLAVLAFKKSAVANDVVVARDGAAALEYLFSPGAPEGKLMPTVVLLDLHLPKIGGLEVLRRIRADERTRLLPVVILTSSNEDEDVREGYAAGANAYVRKPVDFNEFTLAASTIGHFWLSLNQPLP